MILLMNKTFLIAGVVIMFASACVIGSSVIIQSAHACPNKSSGASAQNANPTTPSNVNVQLMPQSPQSLSGQSA
jgi:hypothetical protein